MRAKSQVPISNSGASRSDHSGGEARAQAGSSPAPKGTQLLGPKTTAQAEAKIPVQSPPVAVSKVQFAVPMRQFSGTQFMSTETHPAYLLAYDRAGHELLVTNPAGETWRIPVCHVQCYSRA